MTTTATPETTQETTSKNGVRIVKAEKALKINNPNLKVDIEATPSYPQFDSLQDAVNFAGDEKLVLEGVNTYVKNSVYSNMRQRIRTAPEGSKTEDIIASAEKYGAEWTFTSEGSETVKKAELVERQNTALAMLERAKDPTAEVDIDAIIAALRGGK